MRNRTLTVGSDSTSIKGRLSSIFRPRDPDAESLDGLAGGVRLKYWMFTLVEFWLGYSWAIFHAASRRQNVLKLMNLRNDEAYLERIYWIGFASLICPIVGFLIDEFMGSYAVGALNVSLHFALGAMFFMTSLFSRKRKDGHLDKRLIEIFQYYFVVPVFATDFARILYAFDDISISNHLEHANFAVMLHIAPVSGRLFGWLIRQFGATGNAGVWLAFIANGFVMFIYVYIVAPSQNTRNKFIRSSASATWMCVIRALISRSKGKSKNVSRSHWLDYADTSCHRVTIARTKVLMQVFLMIVPTMGYLLLIVARQGVTVNFRESLKYTDHGVSTIANWFNKSSTLLTMLAVQCLILPVLRVMNMESGFMWKFILGYFLVILALFFVTITLMSLEKNRLRSNLGILRILNTKSVPVKIRARDDENLPLNYTVEPRRTILINFFTNKKRVLFPANFIFDNQSQYTRFLSAKLFEIEYYFIIEPHLVIAVHGGVPSKSSKPGTNDRKKPTILFHNLIRKEESGATFVNDKTKFIAEASAQPGDSDILQVPEGSYTVSIRRNPLLTEKCYLGAGGFYVVYYYSNQKEYFIDIDTMIQPNTATSLFGLGEDIPFAVSYVISYATLKSLIHLKAPEGLKGTAYSILTFAELVNNFVTYYLYTWWHTYFNPVTLTMYSFLMSGYFVLNLCLFLKFNRLYS